jgi:signal transduction histidine kinase
MATVPVRRRTRWGGLPYTDVAIAAAMAPLTLLDVALSPDWRGPLLANCVAVLVSSAALAWRRTRPLGALAVVLGADAALAFAYGASQTWSSVFLIVIAVYSAVVYGTRLDLVVLLTAAEVLVRDLLDPSIHGFGDAIWASSLMALTVAAGLTGRGLRARSAALTVRSRELDLEQEQAATEAAAQERRRIARELHDVISHGLGVMVLQAGAAERILERDPARAREVLGSIQQTGREAIAEMDTLLGLLDVRSVSSREPQPSLASVDALARRMNDAGLEVGVRVEGERRNLPAALEVSAFRVVQEGLTNVFKHAGAGRAEVVLRYCADRLEVEVDDPGGSPGQQVHGVGGGRGLAGLNERLGVFGGRLEAGSKSGGGWLVRATFPTTTPP